ncbi:MAG TPA: hypothetical protein VD902_10010 [Symbiobacteriaceae bacterium]|nr:hypothetical protein [Symbiobacteriaceae bacterium]
MLLQTVVQRLTEAGVEAALGGSGLLCSLGLVDSVRDWDLTTDAPASQVEAALAGLVWERSVFGDGPYATAYRLSLKTGDREIDLMGQFAIRTETGVCRIPTVVCSVWQGMPVGSPEAWAVAYRLMGRHPKADLLAGYIRQHGARRDVVERLLLEPLPAPVRSEVESW